MKPSDAEQLAALWTAAQSTVMGFIRTVVTNRTEADDLLQKTAMACVRKFADYDPQRPFPAWAVGIARFEVLAWRRAQATERHVFDDSLVERITESYERLAPRTGPIHDALAACLEEADGRGREAIDLFYGQEMQTQQVAESLDLSPGAVRTLIYRMRGALKKCIERRLAGKGEQ